MRFQCGACTGTPYSAVTVAPSARSYSASSEKPLGSVWPFSHGW